MKLIIGMVVTIALATILPLMGIGADPRFYM